MRAWRCVQHTAVLLVIMPLLWRRLRLAGLLLRADCVLPLHLCRPLLLGPALGLCGPLLLRLVLRFCGPLLLFGPALRFSGPLLLFGPVLSLCGPLLLFGPALRFCGPLLLFGPALRLCSALLLLLRSTRILPLGGHGPLLRGALLGFDGGPTVLFLHLRGRRPRRRWPYRAGSMVGGRLPGGGRRLVGCPWSHVLSLWPAVDRTSGIWRRCRPCPAGRGSHCRWG